ncbi:phenol 2-monooxygenase [Breoghania corrubedonensis]|uniref:Phenol 2-monooxygenase n=1 Tax=Breoghania corrubedonensis TaxID=665038 RepID=A0A2T5VH00_9HYPH|nr:FAD-binding monooxygenase [Breoghania corrubedonensis]PTW63025.1 phenol 2-monooxygenase [Breoghania corrubedonensis]
MQFHLNGFQTGDPRISAPASDVAPDAGRAPRADGLPETVDVLIVGSGPAGLTLAAQLSVFADIETRIVEQKDAPLTLGQADGIACRTMEMFQAFGFADRIAQEAYWVNETTFWKPDETAPEAITRHGRVQDVEDGLSEFPHVILNQARVHDCYLDFMAKSPRRLVPDHARRLVDLTIDTENGGDYPVHVRLERTDAAHQGRIETVRAKYVVGCDGARSMVRQSLGRTLTGDSANQAWGVMDVLALTDFPDIRLKSAIHSASEGNILIIPREGGYLVRLYVEMDKLASDERVAARNITVDHLIAAAKRILSPYTLEVKEVAWWSVYEIGQRLTDRFDDVPEADAATRAPRVFIAGDACHTHSPKAGQGMNVSMQDTFNLAWKLAYVLKGRAAPELLATYSAERRAIAQELIDFDRDWAKMFSAAPRRAGDGDGEGVDPQVFQDYFIRFGRFTAGTATRYRPSVLTGDAAHQALAEGFPIGMRFHSAPVVRLADAKPLHLGHTVEADGRWRLFAFADESDPADPGSAISRLCTFLADDPASPVRRFTPQGGDIDAVIDVRAIFQQGHRDLRLEAMPAFLLPKKGRYGLTDYEKMFCPDPSAPDPSAGDIFDTRAIDRAHGALVVVRPDQYVAHVLPLGALKELTAFFARFLIPAV